eukprot:m.124093 g.124093  ORF g.124093 m.124093 type:complete len:87 (-) comp15692_c0_seq5:1188-1448(-)
MAARRVQALVHVLNTVKDLIALSTSTMFLSKYSIIIPAYLSLLQHYCYKQRVEKHKRDQQPTFTSTPTIVARRGFAQSGGLTTVFA